MRERNPVRGATFESKAREIEDGYLELRQKIAMKPSVHDKGTSRLCCLLRVDCPITERKHAEKAGDIT